jgi:Enoyl-(Acyl carrier protein) reductase
VRSERRCPRRVERCDFGLVDLDLEPDRRGGVLILSPVPESRCRLAAAILGITQPWIEKIVHAVPDRLRCVFPGAREIDVSAVTQRLGEVQLVQRRAAAKAQFLLHVPSGCAGEPWDVANAVLFLASAKAKYINAAELVIDGGLSASVVGRNP